MPDLVARFTQTPLLRPFDRTAGDEVQAVTDDPEVVVDVVMELVALGGWSVGVGVGAVEEPLPMVTRAGRGPAFEAARTAVTRAKRAPGNVSLAGGDPSRAADASAVLALLAIVVARRSPEGHEAVALVRSGVSQSDIAEQLGISKQAVSQRLSVAEWQAERDGRAAAVHLVAAVERAEAA
ncbi:Winged helix-turn-helix DNA-binding [Williamsia deligens]|nr:Winged helix-turn-helix DNA-binding [Williamsia deligens]